MKGYALYYRDRRLQEAEVEELLDLAWQELYELEFDQVFGGWRGVHYDPKTNTVHITWETMYGGPPLMISIDRTTHYLKNDYPPDELIELEEVEIERVSKLPAGYREEQGSEIKAKKEEKAT